MPIEQDLFAETQQQIVRKLIRSSHQEMIRFYNLFLPKSYQYVHIWEGISITDTCC